MYSITSGENLEYRVACIHTSGDGEALFLLWVSKLSGTTVDSCVKSSDSGVRLRCRSKLHVDTGPALHDVL